MDEQQNNNKKWFIVGIAAVALVIGLAFFWFFASKGEDDGLSGTTAFFGIFGGDEVRPRTGINPPDEEGGLSGESGAELPRLRKLSTLPVAGALFYKNGDGVALVRYMEKEKGNIYDVEVDTARESRVTNETIARVHDAVIGNNGSTVILRFVNSFGIAKTRLAQIAMTEATSSPTTGVLSEGEFLPDETTAVSISEEKNSVFFLRKTESGTAGGLIDLPTRGIQYVFDFPFSEWIPQLNNAQTLFLTTKASGMFPGYSYEYRTDTRTLGKKLDAKMGLTTLYSPSGDRVLYSEVVAGHLIFSMIDFAQGPEEDDPPFPAFVTLPEKCTWTKNNRKIYCGAPNELPNGLLPDVWYQGKTFFDDNLWAHDFETGISDLLAMPQELVGESFDIVSPFLSDDGGTLFFINKGDGVLWAYTLGTPPPDTQGDDELSPEELKDALGSVDTTTLP